MKRRALVVLALVVAQLALMVSQAASAGFPWPIPIGGGG